MNAVAEHEQGVDVDRPGLDETLLRRVRDLGGGGRVSHEVFSGHAVIIFDECHRSQFGDMHTDITRAFKRYNLFGFTGTPIFAVERRQRVTSAAHDREGCRSRTAIPTIVDDHRRRHVGIIINTIKVGNPDDSQVSAIDRWKWLLDVRRIRTLLLAYTLEHFDQKTRRSSSYEHGVVTNVADSAIRN